MKFCRPCLVIFAAPALCWGTPVLAQTSCDAANQYSFAFSSQSSQTLSYANNYNYTASNSLSQTVNFNVSFATFGLSSTVVAGRQMPEIGTLVSGASVVRNLVLGAIFTGRTPNIATDNRVIVTTFAFAEPVRELSVLLHDVDYSSNQFRDLVQVIGRNGASNYTADLSSQWGNNNTGGSLTAGGSSVKFGPTTAPVTVTVDQAVGTSSSGNNSNTGDIDILFDEPVTSVEIRYANAPLTSGESNTGQQAIGIERLSFCPMPVIAVSKSSAPYDATGPERFNIPDSDVVYTITVSNNGGSTVDANQLNLADILPPELTFFNGDFNGAAPGTDNFEFVAGSSGLSLTAANISYSNNGGTSYGYSPGAGYDANVDAIAFEPTGIFAANSSFAIRFRARID
jgi:uncharacterized repeat protein (TIGR01451 family)